MFTFRFSVLLFMCGYFLFFTSFSSLSNLTVISTESTNNRPNTKNLNRIFKRHFSVTPTKLPVPTTTESSFSYHFGEYYPVVSKVGGSSAEYRRSNDLYYQNSIGQEGFAVVGQRPPVSATNVFYTSPQPTSSSAKPVQLFQEIKVSFSKLDKLNQTTFPKPLSSVYTTTTSTTTPSTVEINKTLVSTPSSKPSSSSFSSIFSSANSITPTASSAEFAASFVTRPSDQCRCVCRHGHRLESYDIELEELKAKLLQAELLSESKSRLKHKVEDVLDSLVDEDENDYDDIDELEAIQKPTKYIPMEIIELSHRRPTSKVPSPLTSSTSGRVPAIISSSQATTTTTSSPSNLVTTSSSQSVTAATAPAYSVSFQKPSITLKMFATRVVQLGIPLLVTVALGNALTQIELFDRSGSSSLEDKTEDNHRRISDLVNQQTFGNFTSLPYWQHSPGDHLKVPVLPASGYSPYLPIYEAFKVKQLNQNLMEKEKDVYRRSSVERRRMSTTKKQSSSESLWRHWYDRLVN